MTELPEKIEAGELIDVQLAPYGKFECHDGNEENERLVQIVDDKAIDEMIDAFKEEILVDLDHHCLDGASTEAAAWIQKLYKDPEKGLMGTFKMTPVGAEAVSERRYRFISPTWYVGKDGRPFELHSVALTNLPNLPVAPILNARVIKTAFKNDENALKNSLNNSNGSLSDLVKETLTGANLSVSQNDFKTDPSDGSPGSSNQETERSPEMDELKTLLGLGADATEADIAEAVKALKAEITKMQEDKAEAEAEAFANENECKGIDKETLKNAFRAAPEVAKNMIGALKVAPVVKETTHEVVCNSAAAKEPQLTSNGYASGKTPEERIANIH